MLTLQPLYFNFLANSIYCLYFCCIFLKDFFAISFNVSINLRRFSLYYQIPMVLSYSHMLPFKKHSFLSRAIFSIIFSETIVFSSTLPHIFSLISYLYLHYILSSVSNITVSIFSFSVELVPSILRLQSHSLYCNYSALSL